VLSSHDHNSSAMRYVAVSNMAYDRFKESGGLAEHQSEPMLDKQFRLLTTDEPRGLRTVRGPGDYQRPECPGLRGRGRPRWLERPDDHKLHAFPADRGAGIIEPAAVSPGHWATSVERP